MTASLFESQLFLELQGAHGSDRFEVMMEPETHAKLSCNVFNQRLVKVFPQSIDGSGDVVSVAT